MSEIEAIRQRYRPPHILTLFVGESAPHSGKFFYCGNTALKKYMQEALQSAGIATDGDFLESFKALGWYLDDLVLTPVNQMTKSERVAECLRAQNKLAQRIAEYRPLAIVPVLFRIKDIVKAAADEAGSTAAFHPVPFPGNGQQGRFRKAMEHLIPLLPKESG
jgi:hypothetical protein